MLLIPYPKEALLSKATSLLLSRVLSGWMEVKEFSAVILLEVAWKFVNREDSPCSKSKRCRQSCRGCSKSRETF